MRGIRAKRKQSTTVEVPIGPGDLDLLAAALDAVTEANMERMAGAHMLPCCVNCGEFGVLEPSEASHAERLVRVRSAEDVARTGNGTCADLACYDAAAANIEQIRRGGQNFAFAEIIPDFRGPGRHHVVVRRMDGSTYDPTTERKSCGDCPCS